MPDVCVSVHVKEFLECLLVYMKHVLHVPRHMVTAANGVRDAIEWCFGALSNAVPNAV